MLSDLESYFKKKHNANHTPGVMSLNGELILLLENMNEFCCYDKDHVSQVFRWSS